MAGSNNFLASRFAGMPLVIWLGIIFIFILVALHGLKIRFEFKGRGRYLRFETGDAIRRDDSHKPLWSKVPLRGRQEITCATCLVLLAAGGVAPQSKIHEGYGLPKPCQSVSRI